MSDPSTALPSAENIDNDNKASDASEESASESKGLETLEEELLEDNPDLFKNVPEESKERILRTFSYKIERHHHTGPIPSPDNLDKYNNIIPNGADRIMKMAEKQQEHRMKCESTLITEQLRQSSKGQNFGFIIGLFTIGCGAACVLMGHEWSGAFIGGAGLTGLVSVFVIGKNKQARSLDKKKPLKS